MGYVNAKLAQRRLNVLLDAGLNIQSISRLSGIHPQALYPLKSGRREYVLKPTYQALMNVTHSKVAAQQLTPKTKVDGESARLQIQALHSNGWCPESLDAHSGIAYGVLYRIMRGHGTYAEMRDRVDALYQELRLTEAPQSNDVDRARYRRSKRKAEENGWSRFDAEDRRAA